MIEAGVYQLVSTSAGVIAAVGANVFPVALLPDAPLPAITYSSLGVRPDLNLDGSVGWQMERIRFRCYGLTESAVVAAAQALFDLLDTWSGELPGGGPVIQVIDPEPGPDFFLSDARIFGKTLDFIFSY